jgi:C_GCAxxG_C_C family probable redox protein
MISNRSVDQLCNQPDPRNTTRRAFITQGFTCTAGLTLLAFPGILSEVVAQNCDKSKEEIYKEIEEKAEKCMQRYGTCSQSSFSVLNEQFALKGDEIIRALKPFAGGIAGKGETCGAVSGSLLALGLFFEAANPNTSEKSLTSIKYGALFFDRFKEEFGSTRCSEVVEHQFGRKYNFLNPDEAKLFREAAKNGKCLEVVKKAVAIAGDLILENS